MAERLTLFVDGRRLSAPTGASVAAALLDHGVWAVRRSVGGEPRAPLCGMGTCFECRVTIDGRPHQRACQVLCCEGMSVETLEGGHG